MAKRQNEYQSIKDLMKTVIKENNLTKGMQKMDAREAWEKLMGAGVMSYTDTVQLQNTTLVVKLKSSVLREELSYGKEKIVAMINEELGQELVKKLMLV
ncbi:MAG: RNA-binding protein [Flavobacteriaceae bacterium]|nr:MAG: RNA-binding protein [Flavobacteriaceae bacterium]